MRCSECRATDVWQVVRHESGKRFARVIQIGTARPRPGEWYASGDKRIPAELRAEKVPPSFYCVSCYAYREDAEARCSDLRSDLPPSAAAAAGTAPPSNLKAAAPFDLDKAIEQIHALLGERAQQPLELTTPRPAKLAKPGDLQRLQADASKLLTRELYLHQLRIGASTTVA